MQHWVYTEAGHHHRNEDSVRVLPHPENPKALLCVLADGQGGNAGGAAASRIAAETCLAAAGACSVEALREPECWYPILSAADDAVEEDADAGLTTLIGLCVTEAWVYGASCGDSAVQLLEDGHMRLLTEDQNPKPPIGSRAAYPVAFEAKLSSAWTLLLMSDGVWRDAEPAAIAKIGWQCAGQALIDAIRQRVWEQNRNMLPDDFSIILLQREARNA